MPKWLLWVVVGLALVLRVVGIGKFPAGFSADEVNQGYSAYSILKTGRDEWGKFLPLAPRSYGDFRAPLYTYLTIPSVAFLGLNEFAVRLPSALFGTLAVLVTYFLVYELFRRRDLALLSSFLLAISPWHIMLSRGAFEPNLPTLLIPLGWLLFEKGRVNKKLMVASGVIFGLSLFSYYSARFMIPIFLLFLLWFENRREKIFVFTFIFFLILAGFTMFWGGGTRSSDVAIFNPTGGWGAVSDQRYEAVLLGLPDIIARIFSNKITYPLSEFIRNYLSFLSPQFLFTGGAGEATYGMMPGIGLLNLVELPFLLVGAYSFVKNANKKPFNIILLLILVAPIPAALSKSPGFPANRVALTMPFVQLVSAYGFLICFEFLKPKLYKKVFVLATAAFLGFGFVFFAEKYLYHAPNANARSMSYGFAQAFGYINEVSGNYQRIIIDREFSEPQMFTAFYTKMDPLLVQKESVDWLRYETLGLKFVDQLGEYKLGKFIYKDIDQIADLKLPSTLLVGRPKDFPLDVKAVKTISYPDGKPAILIVESLGESFAYAD